MVDSKNWACTYLVQLSASVLLAGAVNILLYLLILSLLGSLGLLRLSELELVLLDILVHR